jgi:2-polyprenyl-3-methyl-5-hydroxy-6-metoxy-1,4-benzoquinol methylase
MNMSEIRSSTGTYALGHAQREIRRLLVQGQLLNAFTLRLLENAGITAGVRVLDVGCGPGDVSLLAAEMVGKTGSVLGVDTNASVLQVAQARAQEAGLKHVFFLAADIRDLALDGQYDAIVGRLILEHLPEHTTLLNRLLYYLRPGGVVAFQEYDMVGFTEATLPHSELWEQACSWVVQVFQQVGVETRMGMKLSGEFLEVGLPAPEVRYEATIGTGPAWVGYEWLAGSVRAVLPLILKFGIATAEEVGIETLEDRLREEVVTQGGVARLPALVSAWTRKA